RALDHCGYQAAGGAASTADPQEPERVPMAEYLDTVAPIGGPAYGAGHGGHQLFDLVFAGLHNPPPWAARSVSAPGSAGYFLGSAPPPPLPRSSISSDSMKSLKMESFSSSSSVASDGSPSVSSASPSKTMPAWSSTESSTKIGTFARIARAIASLGR